MTNFLFHSVSALSGKTSDLSWALDDLCFFHEYTYNTNAASYSWFFSQHLHVKVNSDACVHRCRTHEKCICKMVPCEVFWVLIMWQSSIPKWVCVGFGWRGFVLTETTGPRQIEGTWIKGCWADTEKICQIPLSEPRYLITLVFLFCPSVTIIPWSVFLVLTSPSL